MEMDGVFHVDCLVFRMLCHFSPIAGAVGASYIRQTQIKWKLSFDFNDNFIKMHGKIDAFAW